MRRSSAQEVCGSCAGTGSSQHKKQKVWTAHVNHRNQDLSSLAPVALLIRPLKSQPQRQLHDARTVRALQRGESRAHHAHVRREELHVIERVERLGAELQVTRSVTLKFLNAEISKFVHDGAVMMSRPDVPNFRGRVAENAAGLNQYRLEFAPSKSCPGTMPLNTLPGRESGRIGTLCDIARSRSDWWKSRSADCPVCQEAIVFTCQPPTTRSAARPMLPSVPLAPPEGQFVNHAGDEPVADIEIRGTFVELEVRRVQVRRTIRSRPSPYRSISPTSPPSATGSRWQTAAPVSDSER